jgi:hypothetical protein
MNKIEDWVPPSYTDIRTAYFKDHPFHCADCGVELNFKHASYNYQAPGKQRVILHASHNMPPLCGHCLSKRIKTWFNTKAKSGAVKSYHKYDIAYSRRCDICGTKTLVARIIWDPEADCRFGSNSWNGAFICSDCLCECAEKSLSTESTGVGGYEKGSSRRYTVNEVGAKVYKDQIA